jgi:xylulokinase
MSLLGLDLGTSACKAAIFDEDGNLLSVASREYSADVTGPGWMEMPPERLWDAASDALREATSGTSDAVKALAVSSQGETFVPVDARGNAIAPAIMNADNRAVDQVAEIAEALGKEAVHSITGCVLHPMYALPKIMWLKKHRPELFGGAARFLSVGDYALARLGVEPYTDYSLAARTMAFDVTRREWSRTLLDAVQIDPRCFPEAWIAGTVAGGLSAAAASSLGLSKGVVVAVGGHDQPCGALGAGVVGPGDTADSAGSYECLTVVSDAPTLGAQALSYNLNSYCHVVPDQYVTLAFFPAGVVLRWFRDQFAQEEIREADAEGADAYDVLIRRLPGGPSGICFTPHFLGSGNPTWNVNATGAALGFRLDKTKHHVFKAILEGIACEIKTNIDVLQECVGPVNTLRTTGGGAKSPYWLRMRADITGKRIASMRSPEAVCLGAAILAGVGAGVFRDAKQGAAGMARVGAAYEPDAGSAAAYAAQIAQYERLYRALDGAGLFG